MTNIERNLTAIQRLRLKADIVITVSSERRLERSEMAALVLGLEEQLNCLKPTILPNTTSAIGTRLHFIGDSIETESW